MRQHRAPVGGPHGRRGVALDPVVVGFARLVRLGADEVDIRHDRGQQIVEIVREAAGQLTHGLHFLRLTELRFHLAPLGEIAGHLGEADERTVSSRMASMMTVAQKRVPSLRTRQPSAS